MLSTDELFETLGVGSVISVFNREDVPRPFAFLLNVSDLADASSLEIAPGFCVRRANPEEIKFIKTTIRNLFGEYFGDALWEMRKPKSGRGKLVRVPAKDRRYFVVEFDSETGSIVLLEETLLIATVGLDIGLTVLKSDFSGVTLPACIYHPPRLFQSLLTLSGVYSEDDYVRTLTESDCGEITGLYSKLKEHNHKVIDLQRPISLLRELKDLPPFSPLQILGYFAILELVLTHQPNPDDRYDSITRQIASKLALLNKRWPLELDYTQFKGASHGKVWAKMYAYRSAIAHGRLPDFKRELLLLKSERFANALIRETVKKTIRQALFEPRLVADLHDC